MQDCEAELRRYDDALSELEAAAEAAAADGCAALTAGLQRALQGPGAAALRAPGLLQTLKSVGFHLVPHTRCKRALFAPGSEGSSGGGGGGAGGGGAEALQGGCSLSTGASLLRAAVEAVGAGMCAALHVIREKERRDVSGADLESAASHLAAWSVLRDPWRLPGAVRSLQGLATSLQEDMDLVRYEAEMRAKIAERDVRIAYLEALIARAAEEQAAARRGAEVSRCEAEHAACREQVAELRRGLDALCITPERPKRLRAEPGVPQE